MINISRFIVAAIFLVLILMGWFAFQFFTPSGSVKGFTEVKFQVSPGNSFKKVAKNLESQSIVKDSLLFMWMGILLRIDQKIKVGEYLLNSNMSPYEILLKITSGQSITYPITIQEGLNLFEIANIFSNEIGISKDKFIKLANDKKFIKKLLKEDLPSLEGYLFPETYLVSKFTSEKQILEMMVSRFLNVYNEIEKPTNYEFSRHQVIILASIVEKETGARVERPLIASVFLNRLKKRMRLQSDPTIIYGLWVENGEMSKNITKADILNYTPYNTYRVNGLPLGPISNPGKEAIQAIYKPENSNYLYFVSKNDGTHQFSDTLKAHNNAVKIYQLDRRQREGKSWRDLDPNARGN